MSLQIISHSYQIIFFSNLIVHDESGDEEKVKPKVASKRGEIFSCFDSIYSNQCLLCVLCRAALYSSHMDQVHNYIFFSFSAFYRQ